MSHAVVEHSWNWGYKLDKLGKNEFKTINYDIEILCTKSEKKITRTSKWAMVYNPTN